MLLLVWIEGMVRQMQQHESIRNRCFFGHPISCYLLCELLLDMVFACQNKVLLDFKKHDLSSLYLKGAPIMNLEKIVLWTLFVLIEANPAYEHLHRTFCVVWSQYREMHISANPCLSILFHAGMLWPVPTRVHPGQPQGMVWGTEQAKDYAQ